MLLGEGGAIYTPCVFVDWRGFWVTGGGGMRAKGGGMPARARACHPPSQGDVFKMAFARRLLKVKACIAGDDEICISFVVLREMTALMMVLFDDVRPGWLRGCVWRMRTSLIVRTPCLRCFSWTSMEWCLENLICI